jgi:hypothetical protein
MSAVGDPRFAMPYLIEHAGDPRTRPMVEQWRLDVLKEREACSPADAGRYAALIERFDIVLGLRLRA